MNKLTIEHPVIPMWLSDLIHDSYFTGMAGFDIGAEMSGIKTVSNCEILDFNRSFLKRKYPNAEQHKDIREVARPAANIISGGFPCQNISLAASRHRTGVDGDKSGLWRYMLRLAAIGRPLYIIMENSATITKHGFDIILREFAAIGYDAEWQTLCGYQFGIPQRRRRLYAVFYPFSLGNGMAQRQVFTRWDKPVYPAWRDTEPKIYGVADVIPYRVDKHRALGNAVQPLIAHYIFECIKQHYAHAQ